MFRGNFWLASAIWLEGDAVGRIRQMLLHSNHAENNSGLFLYLAIILPLVILFLNSR